MFASPKPEDEENKFKQRIVGALVLIALAVIIVPLVLDFRKDYGRVIKGTNIPPKPDDFRVEVMPLTPPEDLKTLPANGEPAETSSPAPPPESAAPAATPPKTVKQEPAPGPAKTVTAKKPAPPPGETASTTVEEGWIVQLGSFSSKQNAEDLRDQIQKKGFKAFVDEVMVDGKPIQRVRIGPMEKKSGAEAIRDKLAADMKLDAIVLSYH